MTETPLSRNFPVHIASGSSLNILFTTTKFTNLNAFFVPNLFFNLLSMGQLCDLDLDLHFLKHDPVTQDLQIGKQINWNKS